MEILTHFGERAEDRKVIDSILRNRPNTYNEREAIIPDGEYAAVEGDRQVAESCDHNRRKTDGLSGGTDQRPGPRWPQNRSVLLLKSMLTAMKDI